jgi:hypothetical protein
MFLIINLKKPRKFERLLSFKSMRIETNLT